jgi:hypothetical protein
VPDFNGFGVSCYSTYQALFMSIAIDSAQLKNSGLWVIPVVQRVLVLAVLLLAMIFASRALAGTTSIGIRFILSDELGQSAAQRLATRAKLESYVGELNGYYRNSEVMLQADIVDVEFSRIEAVDVIPILDDMAHQQNGFEGLFKKADEFGADYTIVMSAKLMIDGKRWCGRAVAVNKTLESIATAHNAYAVINFICGSHTLAHELGHLMGLNHGALVDQCQPKRGHTSAIAPYANGYAEGDCDSEPQPGEFGTIMVGGHMSEINGDNKGSLPIFSNPRIRDRRCGVKQLCGDFLIGDAARALNEHAQYYAMHEEPDVHTLHYESAGLLACISSKYRNKEILELEELVCPNADIDKVGGIEKLVALRSIDLSGNRLQDISPLEQFRVDRIEKIDLQGNEQLSCSSLDRLSGRFPGKVVRPVKCSQRE